MPNNCFYTPRELEGIKNLYKDKLSSLNIRSFKIANRPNRTGVIITLAKPFPRGTRWDLVYGVPADIEVRTPNRKRKD